MLQIFIFYFILIYDFCFIKFGIVCHIFINFVCTKKATAPGAISTLAPANQFIVIN